MPIGVRCTVVALAAAAIALTGEATAVQRSAAGETVSSTLLGLYEVDSFIVAVADLANHGVEPIFIRGEAETEARMWTGKRHVKRMPLYSPSLILLKPRSPRAAPPGSFIRSSLYGWREVAPDEHVLATVAFNPPCDSFRVAAIVVDDRGDNPRFVCSRSVECSRARDPGIARQQAIKVVRQLGYRIFMVNGPLRDASTGHWVWELHGTKQEGNSLDRHGRVRLAGPVIRISAFTGSIIDSSGSWGGTVRWAETE